MTNGHNNGDFSEQIPPAGEQNTERDFDSLTPEEQVEIMRRDLEEIRQDALQTKEQVQRAQAELANFRKRTEEEYRNLRQDANRLMIMKLLPVIDELELAINHLDENEAADSWVEGVKLIHRKAYGILEAEGLSRIETFGVQFDPSLHEAVGVVDSDEYPSGYVVEAVRNGYRLKERVIQAAQVVVAR